MAQNEIKYYKCVGIKDGELYMLGYVFNDTMHGSPFHGATGSVFMPLSQEDVDERNDIDNLRDEYRYIWQESVKDGKTEGFR